MTTGQLQWDSVKQCQHLQTQTSEVASNADFRGRIAQVCDSFDRSATRAPTRRLRFVGGERMSQATTIAARIEPEMESDMTLEDSEDDPSALDAEPLVPPPVPRPSDYAESVEWSIQGDSEYTVSLLEVVEILPFRAPQLRGAFAMMHLVDARTIFRQRAAVMKSVPRFLHGPFRNALKLAIGHGGGVGQRRSSETRERVEGLDDVAKNVSASTMRERAHLTGKVDRTIRIISMWRLAHLVGSQRSLRFHMKMRGSPSRRFDKNGGDLAHQASSRRCSVRSRQPSNVRCVARSRT